MAAAGTTAADRGGLRRNEKKREEVCLFGNHVSDSTIEIVRLRYTIG